MADSEVIARYYSEAVHGLREDWLKNETDDWYRYIINLPPKPRFTYCIVLMNNQVFNGGFHQYFLNRYGQFAQITVDALRKIKALKKAALLEHAVQLINPENYTDEVFRQRLLRRQIEPLLLEDDMYRKFEDLDDKYYEIEQEENIERLLAAFLLQE